MPSTTMYSALWGLFLVTGGIMLRRDSDLDSRSFLLENPARFWNLPLNKACAFVSGEKLYRIETSNVSDFRFEDVDLASDYSAV